VRKAAAKKTAAPKKTTAKRTAPRISTYGKRGIGGFSLRLD
jgi:hypothetical protein